MSGGHFDHIAEHYDASLPAHVVEHYLAKRVAYVERLVPPGSEVLDVGCGTGVLASRLAARGFRVTGVDPSSGMLDVLRAHDTAVRAMQGDGTALPVPDGAFALVLCVAVMHHVAAPAAVRETLREMARAARPGGRILVWDHNPRNPYWRRLMAKVPQDTGEERLIPAREIEAGLNAGGADVVSAERLGWMPDFVPPRLLGAAAALERAAERVPLVRALGAHNVIVGVRREGAGAGTQPSRA